MSKRRYTNMAALMPAIAGIKAAGISHREIEDELGLEGDRPVHNLLKWQRSMGNAGTSSPRRTQGTATEHSPPAAWVFDFGTQSVYYKE